MNYKLIRVTKSVERIYEWVDAPVIVKGYDRKYRPTTVIVEFQDGKLRKVTTSGPKILKNGKESDYKTGDVIHIGRDGWGYYDIPKCILPFCDPAGPSPSPTNV